MGTPLAGFFFEELTSGFHDRELWLFLWPPYHGNCTLDLNSDDRALVRPCNFQGLGFRVCGIGTAVPASGLLGFRVSGFK